MRIFRMLGLRRLRHQPLRAGLAVVSVAAGVSLAVAIAVTTTSLDGSVRDFGRTLAGPADLRIVGPTDRGGLSLETVAAVEQVEGVAAVVPMVQAVTLVDRIDPSIDNAEAPDGVETATALVLGVDCRAIALVGAVPCDEALLAAAGDRPLVMSAALVDEVGDRASLRTETGRVDLQGVATVDALDRLGGGATVLFPLGAAQARFARGQGVDVAYVVPDQGADPGEVREAIEAVVPEQDAVLSRDDPPPVLEVGLANFLPLFYLLGLFGLATAVILVRNTVTLSLAERRRQLAILGALGASPRTVVSGVVGEAALLGGVGGLVGVALGIIIAGPIVASLSGFTESVIGIELERQVPAGIATIGIALGAGAGAVAAWRPARRALRLDVAAELSGRALVDDAEPPRLVRSLLVAATLLVVGLAMCWLSQRDGALEQWQVSVGPLGFLLASVATFVSASAAPLLLRGLAHVSRGTRRASVRLAFANIVREPRRTGIMAIAIASPVVVGFTTDGFVASAQQAIAESFQQGDDFVSISTVDPGAGSVGFLTPDLLAAAEALPEVARVQRGTFLLAGNSAAEIVGIAATDGQEVDLDPDMLRGEWDPERFAAGEVLIGPALARSSGARAGDTVTVDTPSGPRELTVLGVVPNGDFGGRNIQTTYAQLEALFGPPPVGFATLVPAEGHTEAEVLAAAEAVLGPLDPALRVKSSAEILTEIGESVDSQMVPFRVMQQGLVFVSFVAVFSTLLLVGMQRRRETGLLAAVGAAPPELGRTVVTEALLVAGAAIVQAIVLGLVMLWALIQIVPVIIGYRDPYRVAWGTSLGAAVTALIVTALASAWPAWRASKVEVLEALRYE